MIDPTGPIFALVGFLFVVLSWYLSVHVCNSKLPSYICVPDLTEEGIEKVRVIFYPLKPSNDGNYAVLFDDRFTSTVEKVVSKGCEFILEVDDPFNITTQREIYRRVPVKKT